MSQLATRTFLTTEQVDEAYAEAGRTQAQAEADYNAGKITQGDYWLSVATAQQTFRHLDQEQRIIDALSY